MKEKIKREVYPLTSTEDVHPINNIQETTRITAFRTTYVTHEDEQRTETPCLHLQLLQVNNSMHIFFNKAQAAELVDKINEIIEKL